MSDKITWRPYRQTDLYWQDFDASIRLHAEMEHKLGQHLDCPDFSKAPVVKTFVAERDGKVVGMVYFEAVAEMCFVGTDPEVTASAPTQAEAWAEFLTALGFRQVKVFVPVVSDPKSSIGRALEKARFTNVSRIYSHFERLLRRKKG